MRLLKIKDIKKISGRAGYCLSAITFAAGTTYAQTNTMYPGLPRGIGECDGRCLKDGQTIKTVAGGTLTVRKKGTAVTLVDARGGLTMVTTADI